MTNTQHREQATSKFDLPHPFKHDGVSGSEGICECGRLILAPLHLEEQLRRPETAQHGKVLITEKGI